MHSKKSLVFFLLLFSTLFYSQQKVSVIDAETKKPIPQVRIEYNQKIFYTNDDGNVILPIDAKEINLFSPEYLEQDNVLVRDKIEMSIKYKNIDEVVIRPIDAKQIIESVLKDYDKNYETKTSIYTGTYKLKSRVDGNITRLLIIDMDLWTLNNKYDYRKKIDKFLQINLRNKRFDKNRSNDKTYIFNPKIDQDKAKNSKDQNNDSKENSFLSRLFLYNQLYILNFATKNTKINGTIVNTVGDEEMINFKSTNINVGGLIAFDGNMIYNKKENVIKYLKVTQIQEKATSSYLNVFNNKVISDTNSFTVAYEMYKKNEKYIPSKITMDYIANLNLENKTYQLLTSEEYIFNVQNFSSRQGLPKKIDLTKSFLSNIIDNSNKDSETLLSYEEKAFLNTN